MTRSASKGLRSAPVMAVLVVSLAGLGCATLPSEAPREPGAESGAKVAATSGTSSADAACDESAGIDERPESGSGGPTIGSDSQGGSDASAAEADPDADLDAISLEIEAERAGDSDPFEPLNRRMLAVNLGVDALILDPLTSVYSFVFPELVRQSVRNAFANLGSPSILVNDLLQLEGRDAANTTARFLINSTMGMGGFFDAASSMGFEPHISSFSETLETFGIPSGPFLILPLIGPTTVRDGFGSLVDLAMSPQIYILPIAGIVIVTGSDGFSLRERNAEELMALRESSVDYYSALRRAYLDSRP